MKQKLIPLLLLCATVCGAQSGPIPAAPADAVIPFPGQQPVGSASSGRESTPNMESRPYGEPFGAGTNVPFPSPVPAPSVSAPPIAKSEFQMFAEDAAGQQLTVYGRQLFEQVPTTFAPMDHIPVPADYVIGPGDELLIRAWGKIELQTRVIVDRNGQIFIPKVGAIAVAGLRYQQLEGNIHSAIASFYKDFDLNVTMGQLRSIQIFVLGSARQPGVYTVSSLSTLVNALFASGGPSATGSMRRVQLRRGNQAVDEFDIYDLLRSGDKSHDMQLLPGDVIYIPEVGPQIAILGSVNEPGVYELKNDMTIASILKDAAGMTTLASVDRALLDRVENHRRRQVDEFALDEQGLQRPLKDGDILRIFPISPRVENAVTLRGNVAQPGRYLWHEGMRVSDLIPTRDTLLTRDYWNQQNFLASTLPSGTISPLESSLAGVDTLSPDNFANRQNLALSQRNSNAAQVASLAPFAGSTREPSGPLNKAPRIREYWDRPRPKSDTPTRDVMTDIEESSTEVNWEYAAVERRDDNDLTTRVIPFNLGKAVDTPSSSENQLLKPGDVVAIFSRKDVPLPEDKHAAFVRVGGEVNAPGVYRIHPGETLRELVVQAGGLTPHSYLYASQLTRVSTRQAQEEELKISAAQMQRDLAARYASGPSLAGVSMAEQQAQFSSQQALLSQLTSIHPTGRIVLEIKPESASADDIPLFPLQDGDNYYVPAALGTVQVSGAVYNENAFRYDEQKRLSTYLKAAGGPTRQADSKRIFLIRADGTVVSRQHERGPWRSSFENLKLLPGDAIVVPTKLKSPNNFLQQLPFITQILSQTATTAAIATH